MLILVVLIYVLLIFPIFINIKLFFCKENKKLFFAINCFMFTIIGGYVEQIKEGFAIHVTKNKAIIIPYKKVLGLKSSVKPLKDYHFIKLNMEIDIGNDDNIVASLSIAYIINYVHAIIKGYINQIKPYVVFNQNVNVIENSETFNIKIDSLILFNLLMVLLSLVKIFVEKIINEFRNKKRQNQQSG